MSSTIHINSQWQSRIFLLKTLILYSNDEHITSTLHVKWRRVVRVEDDDDVQWALIKFIFILLVIIIPQLDSLLSSKKSTRHSPSSSSSSPILQYRKEAANYHRAEQYDSLFVLWLLWSRRRRVLSGDCRFNGTTSQSTIKALLLWKRYHEFFNSFSSSSGERTTTIRDVCTLGNWIGLR